MYWNDNLLLAEKMENVSKWCEVMITLCKLDEAEYDLYVSRSVNKIEDITKKSQLVHFGAMLLPMLQWVVEVVPNFKLDLPDVSVYDKQWSDRVLGQRNQPLDQLSGNLIELKKIIDQARRVHIQDATADEYSSYSDESEDDTTSTPSSQSRNQEGAEGISL